MTKCLPEIVTMAVRKLAHEAEMNNEILDAYGMAERIKRAFPGEELATGELVAEMLKGGLRAMELSPQRLILEVILPPGAPSEDDATDAVAMKIREAS